jgi:hypothetical protein
MTSIIIKPVISFPDCKIIGYEAVELTEELWQEHKEKAVIKDR